MTLISFDIAHLSALTTHVVSFLDFSDIARVRHS